MAIFTSPDEQARQEQRVQFRQASGFDKTALAMMGYNASGQQNTYGKILGTISPVASIQGREMAKGLMGENTDVGRQLEATDDEFYAKKASQGKFFVEAAKLAITAGAGAGAAAGAGTTAATTAGTSNLSSVLGSGGTAAPVMGAGVDPSMLANQAPSVAGDLSMGATSGVQTVPSSGMASTDVYSEALKSDAGQTLIDMKNESDIENTKDALTKATEDKAAKDKAEKDKAAETLKTLGKGIPLVGAGVEWYQTSKAHRTAEKSELKKALGKTVQADYNLL